MCMHKRCLPIHEYNLSAASLSYKQMTLDSQNESCRVLKFYPYHDVNVSILALSCAAAVSGVCRRCSMGRTRG